MKLEFSRQTFETSSNIRVHENPSSGNRAVPCGRTGMAKLIVAFRSFANVPKRLIVCWHRTGMWEGVQNKNRNGIRWLVIAITRPLWAILYTITARADTVADQRIWNYWPNSLYTATVISSIIVTISRDIHVEVRSLKPLGRLTTWCFGSGIPIITFDCDGLSEDEFTIRISWVILFSALTTTFPLLFHVVPKTTGHLL
jgi:hypothetical protein